LQKEIQDVAHSDDLPAEPAALRETHVSIVFFVGDRVYKLKKPVKMDFLDFTTLEARGRVCRREVQLNQRLAPDVYLGVAEVVGTDGRLCDYLVVMRRMPDDRRLTAIVQRGEPAGACVREIAREVAAFHARADTSAEISRAGSVEAVRANWESSFETMVPFVGSVLDAGVAARVEALARRYLDGRAPLFARRIALDKIRDGHGDLLADDIFCLPDGPRILDCIEFDDRLRHGDVLADVAFLAMDLERVGGAELAEKLLSWYREFTAETHPDTLAQHYVAYRAHVRAKVSCLRADQGDPTAGAQARQLLGMTEDHLNRGRVVLTIVGGLPGTGKSTLGAALADSFGWTMLRSDEVRKDLAGLGHTTPAASAYREGLYSDATTAATYRGMLDRARSLLELGEPVVLDASWSSRAWRAQAAALATATSSDLVELRCDAPASVTRQRLDTRARSGLDVSDANAEVAARMSADFDPWPNAATVDTAQRPEDAAIRARAAVDAALANPV
jgi:aminoglycoside phosphotransferase family enzyme/predicted kinase